MTVLERTDGACKHWIPVLALFTTYWTNNESVFSLYLQSVNVYYRRWQLLLYHTPLQLNPRNVMFSIILQLLASWEITRLFDSFVIRVRRIVYTFLSQSKNTLSVNHFAHLGLLTSGHQTCLGRAGYWREAVGLKKWRCSNSVANVS